MSTPASPATPPADDYLCPAARKLVKPGQTPCQQAKALNQEGLSHDAVKAMANGLPERDAVKWAGASAEKVANPAHQADLEAIQAAKAWAANPTPEAQQAAAAAAARTDFQTPGAWAAQSAAWAGSGGGLTAHAAAGAVMLAAAQAGQPIPAPGLKPPAMSGPEMAKLAQAALPKAGLPAAKPPATPELAAPGPDGLTLTPAQRAEMAKNCDPYIKLGCEIGSERA